MRHKFWHSSGILFILLAIAFSSLGTTSAYAAGIRYAKPAAAGSGDCSNWANACTLQTALTGAGSGDEVWVMAGVHKATTGTDRTVTFQLKNGVAVYGGFAGTESARNQRNPAVNVTILSGDIDNNDTNSDGNQIAETYTDIVGNNSYNVVTGATNAILDGVTVTGGKADDGAFPTSYGGGMYNYQSDVTVTNVIFSGNMAMFGGGMINRESNSTVTDVTFIGNSATQAGGGMDNLSSTSLTLTNLTFIGNTAHNGGGLYNYESDSTISNATFVGNSAKNSGNGMGGGMVNWNSDATINNVTFDGNNADYQGGGMFNGNQSNPVITNVTFSNNTALTGAGMYNDQSNTTVTNATFSGNSAFQGGGLRNYQSSPTLVNVTFQGNSADRGGGMYNFMNSDPTIRNAIFWGNTATTSGAQFYNNDGTDTPVVSDSVIQDGYAGGTNIITTDPLLGALGNYGGSTQTIPLLPGSPAIQAGNATYCTLGHDQRGMSYANTCDIGAFESQGFTLTITNGNNQGALPNTAFSNPLTVGVAANAALEPVNGGKVTFTPPASGASAVLTGSPATIAAGSASVTAVANGTSGSYSVTASASGAANVNFSLGNRSTPTITWNNPADLNFGSALSATQLNATASVPGAFTYTPSVGTYLAVGSHTLHVDFTPTNTLAYSNASRDVSINILEYALYGDVPPTYWAKTFIDALFLAQVTAGCGNGNFCPDMNITRDQMAVFVLRAKYGASYTPPAVGASTGFSDVPTNHWAAAWIKQMVAEGISGGCGASNFCPTQSVTRAQAAIMLLVAKHGAGYTPPAAKGLFKDVPANNWAAPWVEQLAAEGIASGCGGGNFCPNPYVTRAQVAVFLVTAFNLP